MDHYVSKGIGVALLCSLVACGDNLGRASGQFANAQCRVPQAFPIEIAHIGCSAMEGVLLYNPDEVIVNDVFAGENIAGECIFIEKILPPAGARWGGVKYWTFCPATILSDVIMTLNATIQKSTILTNFVNIAKDINGEDCIVFSSQVPLSCGS